MAVSRIERMLLKAMVYGNLLFDPEALDPEIESDEPASMVRARFRLLDEEQKKPFYDYFRAHPASPFQIYLKSNCDGEGFFDYKFHYEYDRPDRKTEVRRLILAGFDISRLRGEYFTYAQLHELRKAHESGLDVTPFIDNRFSRFQLKVLIPAHRRGFDISEFLDPSISAREMAAAYYDAYEAEVLERMELQGSEKQKEAQESLEWMEVRKKSLDQNIDQAAARKALKDRKVISFAEAARRKNNDHFL